MRRYGYFESEYGTGPRAVEGGIKLQSKTGKDKSWWAARWIAVLESFQIGTRLERGRAYARKGQVTNLDIEEGQVTASVQGSSPTPYRVTIGVKQLTAEEWTKIATALAAQAIFGAKLLAGDMPHDVEDVFKELGLSLFPEKGSDLKTKCSCPDQSNPCKHIAAVYYLIGDEFDRDPFLIFKLRGITREALIAKMGPVSTSTASAPLDEAEVEIVPEPLSASLDDFWAGGPLPTTFDSRTPAIDAALPKQLGSFPLWRGQRPFLEMMTETYRRASRAGVAVIEREA